MHTSLHLMTIAALLGLAACGNTTTMTTSTGTATGGEAGAGGTTSAGGTGGDSSGGSGGSTTGTTTSDTTSSSSTPEICTNPLVTYDQKSLTYSGYVGPYIDEYGGFFAGQLKPFAVDTTCGSVIVGLAAFSNPIICTVPNKVTLTAWAEPSATPSNTAPALQLLNVSDSTLYQALDNDSGKILLFKLSTAVTFKAGEYPFVGMQLAERLCAATTVPSCGSNVWRYRPNVPGQGWAPIDQPNPKAPKAIPPVTDQLVFGLDDCTPSN